MSTVGITLARALRSQVLGTQGNDYLEGDAFANYINGGPGHDTIRGGRGNDFIVGGAGSDQLRGDGGNDVFAFYRGQPGSRDVDTVRDFQHGHDVLFLQGYSAEDVTLTVRSWGTLVDAGDVHVRVLGVGFDASDIEFTYA